MAKKNRNSDSNWKARGEWGSSSGQRPASRKPGSGKGTKKQTMFAILAFIAFPGGVILGVTAFLLHGNGVI
jgi:hypothetical protein